MFTDPSHIRSLDGGKKDTTLCVVFLGKQYRKARSKFRVRVEGILVIYIKVFLRKHRHTVRGYFGLKKMMLPIVSCGPCGEEKVGCFGGTMDAWEW